MEMVVYTFCFVFVLCGLYRLYNRYKLSDDSDIEFETIKERIDYLNSLIQQLQTIEEMITDIESCEPDELEKPVRCEWTNVVGERFAYDLWIDGENIISKEMLKIAYSERSRLRTSLKSEIKKMPERCNENGNENSSFFGEGEDNPDV